MFSEECKTQELFDMFEDGEIYCLDLINDNVKTGKCNSIDEAYSELCRFEKPGLYSFSEVRDGNELWYKLRYSEK